MNVVPFVDEGLGNTSWFVDLGDGRAMVVDAGRDPRPYLAEAERRKVELALAAETHLHADFITGNRELGALGVDILAPDKSDLTWPHRSLHPGDELDLGGLVLRVLATPGHTPEHLAYLLLDGSRPVAVFTGGSLLVGAVARTDLIDREATEELSRPCGARSTTSCSHCPTRWSSIRPTVPARSARPRPAIGAGRPSGPSG
ncbi:hypothetical protein BH24ACT1_BH24ACT1_12370 [soil metagenome]